MSEIRCWQIQFLTRAHFHTAVLLLCPHVAEGAQHRRSLVFYDEGTDPTSGPQPHDPPNPNHLPGVPPPNTIMSGLHIGMEGGAVHSIRNTLGVSYLEFAWLLESVGLCLLTNLGFFSHCFLKYCFSPTCCPLLGLQRFYYVPQASEMTFFFPIFSLLFRPGKFC